jgi:TIR domain
MQNIGDSSSSWGTVFVSYRRADHDFVQPLVEQLRETLAIGDLFFDRESVQPGNRWLEAITECISKEAVVMLAAIGDHWLGEGNRRSDEGRRLDDSNDMVRREIELGLQSQTTLIPVLLGSAVSWTEPGGTLPRLPESIADLWSREIAMVRPQTFEDDLGRLCGSFVGTVVESRMGTLESLSLGKLGSAPFKRQQNITATASLAVRQLPTSSAALRSWGICELHRRNYQAARACLGRALQDDDSAAIRYYLSIAGIGGRRIADLPEWEIFRILDLLEPDGIPITHEAHHRALAAAVKLDYFTSRGRNAPGLDADINILESRPADAAEIRELLRLVPVSDSFIREQFGLLTTRRIVRS